MTLLAALMIPAAVGSLTYLAGYVASIPLAADLARRQKYHTAVIDAFDRALARQADRIDEEAAESERRIDAIRVALGAQAQA